MDMKHTNKDLIIFLQFLPTTNKTETISLFLFFYAQRNISLHKTPQCLKKLIQLLDFVINK